MLTPSQLQRADQVVSELGGGADAIAAAIGLVTAEKNTNPFANNNVQNVCGDPSLPATAELRGITPLIDPAVDVNGDAAALSASSAASPLNADGLSVFDLMSQAGLGDLIVSQTAGANAAAGGNAGSNNQQANNNQNQNQANSNGSDQQADGNQNSNQNQNQNQSNNNNNNQQANGNGNGNANQDANTGGNASCNAGSGNNSNQNAGNSNSNQDASDAIQGVADNSTADTGTGAAAGGASTIAGADFGQCTPTITFEGGQNGRPADEFTFQIADSLARGGQQEALNPNIITNALCNQLTNVCDANDAAKAACEDAKAQVEAAGTRDKSTADLFNSALGFADAVTNPNGGPAEPPAAAGNANKKRGMRRGLRL